MPDSQSFLLIFPQQSDLATELGLPDIDDNLFQRIICNPHIEASNPRERECTEMLCAVLRNTNVLRLHLLRWMADLSGTTIDRFDDLHFVIETEGAIGSKRDDLRIEGWRETEEERERILLWTVEVKVGASFHESTPLDGVAGLNEDAEFVNQVVNYDHWLANQSVQHRAGFVLALSDMSDSLPSNLSCSWRCLSWTKLGLKLQDAVQDQQLPEKEKFLAKHLLGFITYNLWRTTEMSEFELNFDDVALIRAFAAIGRDCEETINRLVEPLDALINDCGIAGGKRIHQKSLYKPSNRSVFYGTLFDSADCKHPLLFAGVSGSQIAIWLETAPGKEKKPIIHAVIQSVLPLLKERNADWQMDDEDGWRDLEISRPLTSLLNATDQARKFESFFRAALEDLLETGVIEQLRERLVD